MHVNNLNNYVVNKEFGQPLDASDKSRDDIKVYFRNLEDELINHIRNYDAIFGCVAWLTNKRILKELSKKEVVQIIVQKEDFLRPDIYSKNNLRGK